MLASWKNRYDKPRWHVKIQRHYFANKGPYFQSYGFSSSHAWMWELDHKEGWELKNWYFWTVVFENTLESPLDWKIKLVNPKGNQPWVFIGRTDAEAEFPIFWPPDAKSWLIGKDPDAGKDWRWKEKGMTEDEMVGWHHWLKGHEFDQALGVGLGQESLECCSPWGHKELDRTEWLNTTTTTVSTGGVALRTQAWESICCWDHLDSTHDWTLLRPLYKLLWFRPEGMAVCSSCANQDKPHT